MKRSSAKVLSMSILDRSILIVRARDFGKMWSGRSIMALFNVSSVEIAVEGSVNRHSYQLVGAIEVVVK